ncbi:MinD/ParA family ATP-binding protein [Mycobacterium sp.]|uniref:MinD/ParA family ATP-binding protein n=1 Tax=Mycobacterium sp. TaxID=1785 RepID=UPI003A5C2CD2
MSESDARPAAAGFKPGTDADTTPISVPSIQAALGQDAQRPSPLSAPTVVADLASLPIPSPVPNEAPVADEPPPGLPGPPSDRTAVVNEAPPAPPVPQGPPVPPVASVSPPARPAPVPTNAPPADAQWPAPPAPIPDPRLIPPGPISPPVVTPFTSAPAGAPPPESGYPGMHEPRMPSHSELGLVRGARPLPQRGWRKAVHRLTGLNPGESEQENTRQRLVARVNQPVRGDYSIAVLSMKGGVGKTTTTIGLGATFAAIRGDRVIAVDANPDFGTLAQRGPDQSRSTVRDLLLDDNIFRYSDIRRYTSQSTSRLEILASERDPATSEAFSDADYRVVIRLLQRFYNLILTDCGTGLVHSAMSSILEEADAIVLVASPAIDAARSAFATLDWLEHHGYGHLVPNARVVISAARPGKSSVNIKVLAGQFLTRIRAVHVIPFDDHLAQGSEIVLDLIADKTRRAFLELAASIADGFANTKRHRITRGEPHGAPRR